MAASKPIPPRREVQDRRGFVSGRLTVIGPYVRRGGRIYWMCRCECGNTIEVEWGNLKANNSTSCGCLMREREPRRSIEMIAGKQFGQLTLIEESPYDGKRRRWKCRCECGVERTFCVTKLKSGRTISCGCARSKRAGNKSEMREYGIWSRMQQRCYNPNVDNYKFYGAKGTIICQGWLDSFDSFLADVGKAPSDNHTIDRKNSHGSYTCGHCDECKANGWDANCRWATKYVQNRNRRKHVRVTHNGKTLLLKEWAELSGIGYHALYSRVIVRSWPFEIAISTPQGCKHGRGSPKRHRQTSPPDRT